MAEQVTMYQDGSAAVESDGVRRRDFINIAAVSFAGVGGASVLIPLITQMAPSKDVLALSSTEVDISAVQPGQAIKTVFRKQPVFIRNLTPAEIAAADKVPVDSLRDPQSLEERTVDGKKNWLVTLGVCTHLGCVRWARRRARSRASSAAISAPATVRTTIPPRASARVRRRRTWKCQSSRSCQTLSSRSVEEHKR